MFKINKLFRNWLHDFERDEVPILVFIGAGGSALFSIVLLFGLAEVDEVEFNLRQILTFATILAPTTLGLLAVIFWNKVPKVEWQEYLLGSFYIASIFTAIMLIVGIVFAVMSIYVFIPVVIVVSAVLIGYLYVRKQEVSNEKQ